MDEQNIAIDIHTNKLLEWMLSRRVCSKDWPKSILTIREKINNAIQDMPIHKGITKLVSGSYINYFHCKKIIAILKETEASSKNFFGSYGSQRMKDWLDIVRLYEKENVYLAEAAQMLIRNVNFEVPGLKKDILQCESLLTECDKKEELRVKSLSAARGEYEAVRKSLGIGGENIRDELLARVNKLPEIYAEVAHSTKALDGAIGFYAAFVLFMLGKNESLCCPIIKYISEKGNTSIYEWKTGTAPVPRAVQDGDTNNENKIALDNPDEINFDAVDFEEINYDEVNYDTIDFSVADDEGIDFGMGIEEVPSEVQIDVADGKCSEEQYESLLDSSKTKIAFIDELKELEAFLKMRLFEMKDTNDILTLSQMQNAPTLVQLQTVENVQKMLVSLQTVIAKMTDPVTNHLYNIKHSPRYVDNLTESLKQKLNVIEKMEALEAVLIAKRAETLKHIKDSQPKMKLIVEKTKELQMEIEQEISRLYKNRPVNIMGGVNAL